MRLKNLFEEISAGTAIVYHRTQLTDENIKLLNNGFIPSSGEAYGKGMYATYDLDSQLKLSMADSYGDIIVKYSIINFNKVLILDKSEQIKIFGNTVPIEKQLRRIFRGNYNGFFNANKTILKSLYNNDDAEYTSDYANSLSNMAGFQLYVDGMVFSGRRDGKVFVLYETKLLNPISYSKDNGKTWLGLKTKYGHVTISNSENKNLINYINSEKFKYGSDEFKKAFFNNLTPEQQVFAVKKNPIFIEYIKNPTDEVQMAVIEKYPYYVGYIKNPNDEVQDYILKNYKGYVENIKNPNDKIKQYLLGNNINENTKKMKIILKESQIKNIISDIINKNDMSENYMFFSNLKQIKRQCELLLELNTEEVDNIIKNGHDWADDHISEAKNNMDQVFDFFMNETSNHEINEGKNKPTNPKLWQASLAWAKTKYDVCPSAYCNGAAAKRYKSKGGGWKKSITEIKNNNFETYHKTYTSAINDALDYAEKKGYTYDNNEVFTKIAMGPKKPKEGDTNRFSISLKKDDKEQKKSLNIQVYGMKETYELNCYIN
jgi:hypothetical protein